MNKFSIVIVFALIAFSIHAQQLEGEFEVLLKSPTNTYAAVDELGNYVMVFTTSKQLECSFFNSTHIKNGDYVITIPSHIKKDDIIGVQMRGDSCSAYFMNTHSKIITELNINRSSGFSSQRHVGQLAFTEKFLTCIYLNNSFQILTATHGKSQIEVHTIHASGLTKNIYQVDMPDLYKRLSTGNHQLNEAPTATLGINVVNYTIENNVRSARSTKKAYTIGSSIYLVFDDADYTQIIQIDLVKNEATYKKFSFSLEKGNSKKQGNSFLYNELLFRVTLSEEQLIFTTIDINEHISHAVFYATPQHVIDFTNGPIVQENSETKQRVIDDNNKFFDKMLKGNVSISANQKDSTYIIEIGSYEEIVSNHQQNDGGIRPTFSVGVGVGMGVGGGSFGMGNMGMGTMNNTASAPPNSYGWNFSGYHKGYPGYYPYNNYTSNIRTTYIHTMLNDSTFEQKSGIVPISLRERISNFEEDKFKGVSLELVQVVGFMDKIIVCYQVPNKKTFRQYSFYK